MTDHRDEASRRAFLAGALGLTATAELWPGALARAMETPAAHRTGTIRDVEHVVIFMQENRSFDHYFGTLSGVRGFADRRPWTLPNGDPVWRQPDGKGGVVTPFRFDAEENAVELGDDTSDETLPASAGLPSLANEGSEEAVGALHGNPRRRSRRGHSRPSRKPKAASAQRPKRPP